MKHEFGRRYLSRDGQRVACKCTCGCEVSCETRKFTQESQIRQMFEHRLYWHRKHVEGNEDRL